MSASQAARQLEELLHQGQQLLLVLLEAQQGAPVVLEVQQVPRLRPQELLLGRSALQEAGHGECRQRRSAGRPAGGRPQEVQLGGARPQREPGGPVGG